MTRFPSFDAYMVRRTALATIFVLAAAPAQAQSESCPATPVPKLSVVVDIADYAYNHSQSVAGLGGIEQGSATTSGHDVKRMLGLTRQGFEVSANTAKAKTLVRPDGSACVGFTDGAIRMRLTTEIFIARELAPESCLYGQILNHEERHANVGRRLFTEFGAEIEAALAKTLKEAPFLPAISPTSAPQEAMARLQEIVAPLYRDFQSIYRKRQAIIDTSGEYARVAAACPGEQERALRQPPG
jgi:hypothetical protein